MFRSFSVVGVVALAALSLNGCGQDGGYGFDFFSSRERELKAADGKCSALYDDTAFNAIRRKMAIRHDELPTKELLSINTAPAPEEVAAIKRLDAVADSCARMRLTAGFQPSATDDIFESRARKLRYGLYTGEIPYSVYNYGIARAAKERTQFALENAEAFQKGKMLGEQMEKEARQQQITRNQLNDMNSMLDDFYRTSTYDKNLSVNKARTCTVDHVYGNVYSSECR